MQVIALAGSSGVGKSTIARKHLRPLGFRDIALADEIKIRAVATGVATYEQVFTSTKLPDVRTWLQQEGTERGRDVFGENVWLRAMYARMRRAREEWGINHFVVSDVRFANEAQYIRDQGGVVLLVQAPLREASNALDANQRQHRSEVGLTGYAVSDFAGVLLNDPADEATVQWQLDVHLQLAGYGDREGPPMFDMTSVADGAGLSVEQKCSLLERMFPTQRWHEGA